FVLTLGDTARKVCENGGNHLCGEAYTGLPCACWCWSRSPLRPGRNGPREKSSARWPTNPARCCPESRSRCAAPGWRAHPPRAPGVYRFPVLPRGTYDLECVLQGFTTLRRDVIPIAVGSTVELDVVLKVSTLSETVTVTGESPVVNLASVQVSTSYNREWLW